jgi:hypothetical protein
MRTFILRSILLTLLSIFGTIGLASNASAMLKSDPNTCNSELMVCPEGEETRVILT